MDEETKKVRDEEGKTPFQQYNSHKNQFPWESKFPASKFLIFDKSSKLIQDKILFKKGDSLLLKNFKNLGVGKITEITFDFQSKENIYTVIFKDTQNTRLRLKNTDFIKTKNSATYRLKPGLFPHKLH